MAQWKQRRREIDEELCKVWISGEDSGGEQLDLPVLTELGVQDNDA